jgi:uncharacterized protein (UPF0303 family)
VTQNDDVPTLEQQERELVFERFDHFDAWRLGVRITEIALEAGHLVAVDIRRPGLILFRSALPGVTADQEAWIARKSALTLRMETSSALVAARHAASGTDAAGSGWLGSEYAITGGSFPVRVRGAGLVAAATASGLTSMEDHDLVVDGIRAYLASGMSA